MYPGNRIPFSDWYTTFKAKLLPGKDKIPLKKWFVAHCIEHVQSGMVRVTDPNGNSHTLFLFKANVKGPYFKHCLKLVRFYGIKKSMDARIVFHYVCNNDFQIQLFSNATGGDLSYPTPSVIRQGIPAFFPDDFFRTVKKWIYPEEDSLSMGPYFSSFVEDPVIVGDGILWDSQGYSHKVNLNTDSKGFIYIESGLISLFQFYHIRGPHYFLIHYVAANNFEFKIISLNYEMVYKPMIVSNSEKPLPPELIAQVPSQLASLFATDSDSDESVEDLGPQFPTELVVDGPPVDQIQGSGESDPANANDSALTSSSSYYDNHVNDGIDENSWMEAITLPIALGRQAVSIPARIAAKYSLYRHNSIQLQLLDGRMYECSLMHGSEGREISLGNGWYEFVRQSPLRLDQNLNFKIHEDPFCIFVFIS